MRFILTIVLFLGTCSSAQTTKPGDTKPLRQWFKQLDDKDPEVRDEARTQLMSIPRARLTDLQTVVSDARPLSPAQVVELKQIVAHVFLTAEPYAVDAGFGTKGFLGVVLGDVTLPGTDNDRDDADAQNLRAMVTARLSGFGAYPILRDGDVIAGVVLPSGEILVPLGHENFAEAIGRLDPERLVKLEIQRGGKTLRVEIRLSRRPAADLVDPRRNSVKFLADRQALANENWDKTFGKLLSEKTL